MDQEIISQIIEIRDITERRLSFIRLVMIDILGQVDEIAFDLVEEFQFQTPFIKHWQGV